MPSKRWIPPVVSLGLVLSAVTIPALGAPPRPPSPADPTPGGTRVTLITGDRVRVTPRPGQPAQVVFEPAKGSRSDAATITYQSGHTYVVPSAAVADVASGRLDRTLFDVTMLIAEHRDDEHSKTMPVIIRYAGDAAGVRAKQTAIPGAASTRLLSSIGAKAAKVTKTAATDFWRSLTPGATSRVAGTVQRVSLDRQVKASLDQSVPQIGAPAAWQRGLTGKGVKVAILDTGIDPTHPDLAGRIGATENFSDAPDTVDHYGHGTHVASITAGNGAASGGKYKGVAPDATLLNGKVLDDYGLGDFSGIIAGMEWAAAQGASVINMSLGGDPSDGTDDLSQAVNRISRQSGALFVIAAGNCFFPEPQTVSSPAAADDALAVGNLQRDGSLNDTSCRGPRKGDGALKPEISAPGTGIVAARAAGTSLGDPVDDNYTTLSGTSMATPHVAGTAALVAQAHPDWKAAQLKARLISTADPQPGSKVDEQGAGRVDADQATDDSVTVDTGELELGVLRWPYPASDKVSRELTYRNPGSTAVTLDLAASVDPVAATPELSSSQLVVPAGGEAKVTVTADRAAGGTGFFSGRVTATAAGADPIVTTFGWYAEPELYNLTVKGINRDGSPATASLAVSRLDGPPLDLGPFGVRMVNGTATLRIPPGKYQAMSTFFTAATDAELEKIDVVTGPETTLTKDTTVTLDARRANPVPTSVQGHPELTARQRAIVYSRKNTDGMITGATGVEVTGAARILGATPTAKPVTGTSEFAASARLEIPPFRAKVIGGDAFTVLDFYFGPRLTGTKTLGLADAGAANPGELDGARGKLALIRYVDSDPRPVGELVKAAERAGAAAALIYNPDRAGQGGVGPYWVYGDAPDATIPAARTTRVAAQKLLDQLKTGPVTVRLTGVASTPVVYDLAKAWPNQIPATVGVNARQDQFARVDEVFGAHTAGTPTSEARTARTPGGTDFSGWLVPVIGAPFHRTSYVLGNRLPWSSLVILDNGGESAAVNAPPHTYRAGERTSMRWVAPVENSGLPAKRTEAAGVGRAYEGLSISISPFRHGPDEFSDVFGINGEYSSSLERNGVEVATSEEAGLWADVPADAAEYKFTLDAQREADFWQYSTQIHSSWTFKARGGEDEVMPLVVADLDVPQTDDLNRVPTGRPITLTLGLRHQAGSTSTARFTTAALELSYDNTHWTKLALTKTADGHYTTTVTHPATQSGHAPSLRLTAADADGNKLDQQITKAYGLK
ncbi:S8 family peptidase [Kribbella monticola]|uniref:S8 family peptidase n=1 Tax=Kribbella monticola TaxID=2185285 RepID=UPI001E376C82|nr:S8 family serine peptidase [Kribbella monticola]